MSNIVLSLGNISLYGDGLFILIGLYIAAVYSKNLADQADLRFNKYADLVLYVSIVGLLGARIGYYLLYHKQFESLIQFLSNWQIGLLAYSGIFFSIIFAYWYLRRKLENPWRWLDIFIVGFFAGWAVVNLLYYLIPYFSGTNPATSFLIQFIWFISSCVILTYLWHKQYFIEGYLFFIGLSLYCLGRAVCDFWKPLDAIIFNLSLNQIVSFAFCILIIVIISQLDRVIYHSWKDKFLFKLKKNFK
jgi:prolipoprotein diacylglyceryltransferase